MSNIQKQLLENRKANLMAKYEAIFNQRESTLNEGDKIPLTYQLEQIDKEIKKVEHELENISPKKYKLNVDDLRPYLSNRKPQERKLSKAIRKQHNKQQPLVCLIHSDDCQHSDKFLERLTKFYFPSVGYKNGITSHFLNCDFSDSIDDLHQEILEGLGEKLLGDRLVSRTEIIDVIVHEQNPIMLDISMSTNDWLKCGGIKLIYEFIKFWKEFEFPVTHNDLLLVCLRFNYKNTEKNNFLTRWFNKKSINDQIRKEFKRLENEDFSKNFGINGVVLPELQNIAKEDVEKWVNAHLPTVSDSVRVKIDELFKSPNETMAMGNLAIKLRKILEEFPPEVFKV